MARNRQREFDAFQDTIQEELDPENDAPLSSDDDHSGSETDASEDRGRDHYIPVEKSKLRRSKQDDIDPRYRGARVDRKRALDDDNDDDNDAFIDEEEDRDSDEQDSAADDGDGSEADMTDDDTEHTELSDDDSREMIPQAIDREQLRRAMAADRSAITTSILAAAKTDAEKGRAVKRQRLAYDSLLNVRIKMQKSLIATNSLAAIPANALGEHDQSAIRRAEEAAFDLYSRLTAYRDEMTRARSSTSSVVSTSQTSSSLVRSRRDREAGEKSHRDAVLQKWSLKSRSVTLGSQRSRINNEKPATIVDILNEQLSNMDRLLQRVRTPRSCAPVQLADRVSQDPHIYDDADFYGLLLKELLETKSAASATAAANVDIKTFINIRREAKTKKVVDTKASKGRKLKYNVHEKLQNFCAPDDRTTWSERQRDELFSSLFGQRLGLQEDLATEDEGSDDGLEDAGLLMFRNAM